MKNPINTVICIVSVCVLALLLVVVGVMGIIGVRSLENSFSYTYENRIEAINGINEIIDNVNGLRILVYRLAAVNGDTDTGEMLDIVQLIDVRKKIMVEAMYSYEATIISPEVMYSYREARVAYENELLPIIEAMVDVARSGEFEAIRELSWPAAGAEAEVMACLYECRDINIMFAEEDGFQNITAARTVTVVLICATVAGVIIAAALVIAFIIAIYKSPSDKSYSRYEGGGRPQ